MGLCQALVSATTISRACLPELADIVSYFSGVAIEAALSHPGTYVISAMIGGEHMTGSPAEVEASTAQAHAPHCEVVGAPITLHTTAGALPP